MRVYVADLSAYNHGVLRGKWWDPTDYYDSDDFVSAVCEYIAGTEDVPEELAKGRGTYWTPEEWAIHDVEGPPNLGIGEYTPLPRVWELAILLEEFGTAFADYVDYVGLDYATREGFRKAYCGQWQSGEEYAEELFSVYEIPAAIAPYVDYRLAWRDLTFSGYWISREGNVFSQ